MFRIRNLPLYISLMCLSFSFLGAYYDVTALPVTGLNNISGFTHNINSIDNKCEVIGHDRSSYKENVETITKTYTPEIDGETHPFIWDENNGKRYLNDLVDQSLNILLTNAISINDNGEILAEGVDLTACRFCNYNESKTSPEYDVNLYLLTPQNTSYISFYDVEINTQENHLNKRAVVQTERDRLLQNCSVIVSYIKEHFTSLGSCGGPSERNAVRQELTRYLNYVGTPAALQLLKELQANNFKGFIYQ